MPGASWSCLSTTREQRMEMLGLRYGGPTNAKPPAWLFLMSLPKDVQGGGRAGKDHPFLPPRDPLGSAASTHIAPRPRGWCRRGWHRSTRGPGDFAFVFQISRA